MAVRPAAHKHAGTGPRVASGRSGDSCSPGVSCGRALCGSILAHRRSRTPSAIGPPFRSVTTSPPKHLPAGAFMTCKSETYRVMMSRIVLAANVTPGRRGGPPHRSGPTSAHQLRPETQSPVSRALRDDGSVNNNPTAAASQCQSEVRFSYSEAMIPKCQNPQYLRSVLCYLLWLQGWKRAAAFLRVILVSRTSDCVAQKRIKSCTRRQNAPKSIPHRNNFYVG